MNSLNACGCLHSVADPICNVQGLTAKGCGLPPKAHKEPHLIAKPSWNLVLKSGQLADQEVRAEEVLTSNFWQPQEDIR